MSGCWLFNIFVILFIISNFGGITFAVHSLKTIFDKKMIFIARNFRTPILLGGT